MPTAAETAAYFSRKRRKASQNVKAYRFLAAAPGDADAGILLPAGGRLAVSSTSATVEGDLVVQIGGEVVTAPGGPANTIFRLSWGERGETAKVTVHPGQATLYILDEWMQATIVAQTA